MKNKNFTPILMAIVSFAFITFSVNAQTYNVPGDHATVADAITAWKADAGSFVDGATLTINVAEGTIDEGAIVQIGKKNVTLTIQGAGADKTTLKGLPERPVPLINTTGDNTKRFLQLNNVNNEGLKLTIKGIKFLNWGFGNTNGGGIVNFTAGTTMELSIEDCEFEGIAARVGAILQSNNQLHKVTFNNCFVHKCLAFDNNSINGLLHFAGTTDITITNNTFMSNERNVVNVGNTDNGVDLTRRNGGIVNIQNAGTLDVTALVENNVFIDNKVADAGLTDVEQVAVSLRHQGDQLNTTNMNVTLIDNIFIENRRTGENKDIDLLYFEDTRINLTNFDGNIANTVVKRVADGFEEDGTTPKFAYISASPLDGFKIDASYTYTDPRIDFEMDGDLPLIKYDEKAVAYVSYSGDGSPATSTKFQSSETLKYYVSNGILSVEGLQSGSKVDVYSITGVRVAGNLALSSRTDFSLNKGIYIVRVNNIAAKVIIP